ncbi:MAG: hypothetical protein V1874_08650 [Spirochaetota bacterium]
MTDQIKTITDRNSFEKILAKFFTNANVFLKTKTADLRINFMGYSDNVAAFRIAFVKSITGNCLIFSWKENFRIHALAKFNEKQGDDVFLFTIEKFQIISKARVENRKAMDSMDTGGSKNIIFVANLISYSIIENSLSMETKKIGRIKEYIQKETSEAFNHSKIFFCNESKNDSRMQYFLKNKKPIFIPQINTSESGNTETENRNFYINTIYAKDHFLQGKKEYISEISVPLLYKQKMPYGYIQVNNTNILTSSNLLIAKKIAMTIEELLIKEKVFPKSDEKLIVSNISKKGIGIVFKERKYIRYFKVNNLIYLDILFPQKKTASVMAMVRNITLLENNVIMIGCSVEEIDALSEVNYDEFLDSIPASKPESSENQEQPAKPELAEKSD